MNLTNDELNKYTEILLSEEELEREEEDDDKESLGETSDHRINNNTTQNDNFEHAGDIFYLENDNFKHKSNIYTFDNNGSDSCDNSQINIAVVMQQQQQQKKKTKTRSKSVKSVDYDDDLAVGEIDQEDEERLFSRNEQHSSEEPSNVSTKAQKLKKKKRKRSHM